LFFFLYLHETNHKILKKKSIKSRKLKKQNTRKKQAEEKKTKLIIKKPKRIPFHFDFKNLKQIELY